MTLKEKIHWIESKPRFKPKVDLNHLKDVYAQEGLHHTCKKVHIVGTNGKGSTAKMLTDMTKSTYRVGTFMSPYVYTFNERILIDGEPVSDQSLHTLLDYTMVLSSQYETLTFFELLTLGALWLFKQLNIELMIMEAGIGGRLDATNIMTYDVSILTSIGHDHLSILGPTLHDVLREKIAVVKHQGTLITGADETFSEAIIAHCQTMEATLYHFKQNDIDIKSDRPLIFTYKDIPYTLMYQGRHYALNATLALKALEVLQINVKNLDNKLSQSSLYGRFEHLSHHIYVDAAHNEESIIALKNTIQYSYQGLKIGIILSVLGDKDIKKMISHLQDVAHIVLTSFDDVRYQDISMHQNERVPFMRDPMDALAFLKSHQHFDMIIFTGSIHFISQIKSKILHTS